MICFVLPRERTYIQNLFRRLFTKVDPELKRIEGENKPEKHALRMLFNGEIPDPVLWRTKAMQCEGVGLTWVEDLQAFCEARVTDEEFSRAKSDYLINPPQSKEELYYRKNFESHFKGMDKFVHVWAGGCRAGGAAWKNEAYTRFGLKDISQLAKGIEGVRGVD